MAIYHESHPDIVRCSALIYGELRPLPFFPESEELSILVNEPPIQTKAISPKISRSSRVDSEREFMFSYPRTTSDFKDGHWIHFHWIGFLPSSVVSECFPSGFGEKKSRREVCRTAVIGVIVGSWLF